MLSYLRNSRRSADACLGRVGGLGASVHRHRRIAPISVASHHAPSVAPAASGSFEGRNSNAKRGARTFPINIGRHHGQYRFASSIPRRRDIVNIPRRCMGTQPDREEVTPKQISKKSSPINLRAANAIISQLSSPPNMLTMSRIVATPYLSYLLVSHSNSMHDAAQSSIATDVIPTDAAMDATIITAAENASNIATNVDISSTPTIALSLFLVMGFTDFLDGYIARTWPSTATVLGTYLDPFADKVFISITSATLWYTGTLPGMLVGLWIVRDMGIVGSVYWLVQQETIRKRSIDEDESGNCTDDADRGSIAVMDPASTPLQVQASFLSKVNTTLQIGLIALGIAGGVPWITVPPELMTSLIWVTAGTTIGSSVGYLDGSALKGSGNK